MRAIRIVKLGYAAGLPPEVEHDCRSRSVAMSVRRGPLGKSVRSRFVERLISRMTLAEKLGQMTMMAAGQALTGPVMAGDVRADICAGNVGSLLNLVGAGPVRVMQQLAVEESRLGIPLLFGFDVIHGHRTQFPIPLAEAAVFHPPTWERTAREAAREAAADGLMLTFAPMLDVARDPRWGRIAEGPGEDPLVGSRLAQAKVRGFQGSDLARRDSLAACAKHFCAYGPVTAGRDYASVDISERTLHEVHLPPFAAAVEAGVACIMPAFTDLAGVPMTAHRELLQDHLRGKLGFQGVLISDYNAIAELICHGVAGDLPQAAALALGAGIDIDMMSDAYRRGLPVALERRLVRMQDIDTAVRRVLLLKAGLGLFDRHARRGRRESAAALARRRRLACEVAARSVVMLKNEARTLPLRSDLRHIAVIGPLADAAAEMRGPWFAASTADDPVSLLQGVRLAWPGASVTHADGVGIREGDATGIEAAASLCDGAEVILLCVGEAATMSGEAACRTDLDLPGSQRLLAQAVLERARALAKPVVSVLFSGRPLAVPWLAESSQALLAAWFPGSEAGHALAQLLAGKRSPGGRTPVSWPRNVGQIPVFHAQRPGGRPARADEGFTSKYLDAPNEPLFPFGYGLTYSEFEYSGLSVSKPAIRMHESLEVRVRIRNVGHCEATETAFLFVHDPVASVARPVLELKDFRQVSLSAGAARMLSFDLPASALAFPGRHLKPVLEPGDIQVLVGPCADQTKLLGTTIRLQPASRR